MTKEARVFARQTQLVIVKQPPSRMSVQSRCHGRRRRRPECGLKCFVIVFLPVSNSAGSVCGGVCAFARLLACVSAHAAAVQEPVEMKGLRGHQV